MQRARGSFNSTYTVEAPPIESPPLQTIWIHLENSAHAAQSFHKVAHCSATRESVVATFLCSPPLDEGKLLCDTSPLSRESRCAKSISKEVLTRTFKLFQINFTIITLTLTLFNCFRINCPGVM